MKTEIIKQIEHKLKANFFDGLLEAPPPNIAKEVAEIEKLILLTTEIQNNFKVTDGWHNDLFLRLTDDNKLFVDAYELEFGWNIGEKEKKKLIKRQNKLLAEGTKLVEAANFDNKSLDLFSKYGRKIYSEDYYDTTKRIEVSRIKDGLEFSKHEIANALADYNSKQSVVESIVKHLPKYFDAEDIDERDTVIINVGFRDNYYEGKASYHPKLINTFKVLNNEIEYSYIHKADTKEVKSYYSDIFIISNRYFIKLSIGEAGLIDRTEHLLRDIKKVNLAADEVVEIFFHGLFDAASIVLDSYADALNLQRKLTNLREVKKDFSHSNNSRRETQFQKK